MKYVTLIGISLLLFACQTTHDFSQFPVRAEANHPKEMRLTNLRQLTFGGENAEAYFSFQEDRIILQSTPRAGTTSGKAQPANASLHTNYPDSPPCDQMFVMDLATGKSRRVSTGTGVTTCGYFLPEGNRVLFASTHSNLKDCPPRPDYSQGYVWALHDFDIYTANADGGDLTKLFASPRYDAEATVSPDGKTIVFTTLQDGDLEIYAMNTDGTGIRRLTHTLGYDGGPFFSPDSKKIVFRASRPKTEEEKADYKRLLAQNLIRPSKLEIFTMNADGSDIRQITNNGKANFAPYWHPDGKRIIFASNMNDPRGRNFDLFLINADGTGLEQITFNESFDSFPMFTQDGKHLIFASNRANAMRGETNVFIADWVD